MHINEPKKIYIFIENIIIFWKYFIKKKKRNFRLTKKYEIRKFLKLFWIIFKISCVAKKN